MGKKTVSDDEKKTIVQNYLEIARKYKHDILISNISISSQLKCNNCSNTTDFDISNNNYICIECGNILDNLVTHTSYKDVERVNITSKYTYDRKIHFRDCINQSTQPFNNGQQGKRIVKILEACDQSLKASSQMIEIH